VRPIATDGVAWSMKIQLNL